MIENLFEITRPATGYRATRIAMVSAPRGKAFGAHPVDPTLLDLAEGTNFIGFVIRDITDTGPTLADHVYPGRLELPYTKGYEVSLEKADEFIAEGADLLQLSGTGALSGGTAVGTLCSFNAGRVRVAQSGDNTYYSVSAQLTPVNSGGVRIKFESTR